MTPTSLRLIIHKPLEVQNLLILATPALQQQDYLSLEVLLEMELGNIKTKSHPNNNSIRLLLIVIQMGQDDRKIGI